jgi:hypothetical protein
MLLGMLAGAAETPDPGAVNKVFGLPMFSDTPLFEEKPSPVLRRLQLRRTQRGSLTEVYSATGGTFAGLKIAEIGLTTHGGVIGELSVNVLNKGDFFSPESVRAFAAAAGTDTGRHPGRLESQMQKRFGKLQKEASQHLGNLLTQAFGEPQRHVFKQDRRRRLLRWDWRDTAFLLDNVKQEYVILRVMRIASADAGGEPLQRIHDSDIRKQLQENIHTADNGDVSLHNVPMVDQGDKGYCGVASAERVLRYFSIPLDSHQLANLMETDKFGGTQLKDFEVIMHQIAHRHKRDFDKFASGVGIRNVAKYIDRGVPLMWGVYLTPEFEKIVAKRQPRRDQATAADWAETVSSERRNTRRIKPKLNGGHLRLIVGYNAETREIAFSDSWDGNRIVWVTAIEAKRFSMPAALYALTP